MPKKKIRLWMVLTLLIPLSFGIAYYMDDCKARGGKCFPMSYVREIMDDEMKRPDSVVKKVRVQVDAHGHKFEFNNVDDLDNVDNVFADTDFEKFEGMDVALPDMSGVKKIVILSRNTDWVINHGSGAKLRFEEDARSYVRKKDDTLTIQTKNHAAEEGVFTLPEDFDGLLQFSSMTGNVRVESGQLKLKEMDLSTLSGDIEIEAYPSEKLSVNATSGNIRAASRFKNVPKEIQAQSVSGDMDLSFVEAFTKLSANTVSGVMHLDIPNTMAFNLNLVSISGEFSGLPETGTTNEAPGQKIYNGSYGKDSKASIFYHSVGGDFHLSQSEVRAPNL